MDEQTEEIFNGQTGPSNPASFINNLNMVQQQSEESTIPKNNYKTEDYYKEIRVTEIDQYEKEYATGEVAQDTDSFQNEEDDENLRQTEDDREIELKTTERNPLLFSDNSRTNQDDNSPQLP